MTVHAELDINMDNETVGNIVTLLKILKIAKCDLVYTKTDPTSRTLVFLLIILFLVLSFYLGIQNDGFGTFIIVVGVVYSLVLLFRPVVIQKQVNMQFILIGVPLFIFLANIYNGDKSYGVSILFVTAIYSGLAIIDWPMSFEHSGIVRMTATVYTVLMFVYLLYEIANNVKTN